MNARQRNTAIREIARECGWEVWSTFSDKRQDGRRYKFMQAGAPVPFKTQRKIQKQVEDWLKRNKIKAEVVWGVGETWRGSYDYLEVFVPNK